MSQYSGGSPSVADELTQITSYVKELRAKHPVYSRPAAPASSPSRKAPAQQINNTTPSSPPFSSPAFPQTPAIPPDVPLHEYNSPPMRFVLQPDSPSQPISGSLSSPASAPSSSPIFFSRSRLGLPRGDSKAVLSALSDVIEKIRTLEKEKSFFQDSYEELEKENQTLTSNLKSQITVLEKELWNLKTSKHSSTASSTTTNSYSRTKTGTRTQPSTKVPERSHYDKLNTKSSGRTATGSQRTTSEQARRTTNLSHSNRTYINAQHSNHTNYSYPPTTPHSHKEAKTTTSPNIESPPSSASTISGTQQYSQSQYYQSQHSHAQSQSHETNSSANTTQYSRNDESRHTESEYNSNRNASVNTDNNNNNHDNIKSNITNKTKTTRSISQPHYRSPQRQSRQDFGTQSGDSGSTKHIQTQTQNQRRRNTRPRSVSTPRNSTAPATLTMRIPAPDPPFLPSGQPHKSYNLPANIQKALAMLALAHVSYHHHPSASSPRKSSPPPRPCTRSSCASSPPPHSNSHSYSQSQSQSQSHSHSYSQPPAAFLDLSYTSTEGENKDDEDKAISLLLDSLEREAEALRAESARTQSQDPALRERIARKDAQLALLRELHAQHARILRPHSPLKGPLVNEKHLQAIHILHSLQDLHSQQ